MEVLVGEDRVGEPQLLAHPLEQPARHPAAEHVGQDREMANRRGSREREGVACRRRCGSGRCRASSHRAAPRRAGPGATAGAGPLPGGVLEPALRRRAPSSSRSWSRLPAAAMTQLPRIVAGLVEAPEVAPPRARRGCRACPGSSSRRDASGHSVSAWSSKTRSSGVSATPLISSSIDVPLGLEIALAEQRPADQVGEDVHREREVRVEHVGLVAGGVARRCRRRGSARGLPARARAPARSAARSP